MTKTLLDTDTLSYFLKGDKNVRQKVQEYLWVYDTLNIASITYFEVLAGLEYKKAVRQITDFELLVQDFNILNVSLKGLKIAAIESGCLRRNGITIGKADLFIASIALVNNLTLVTNNTKHFKHIKGLKLVNWK